MATSIVKPITSNETILSSSRSSVIEGTFQIFIPPKPNTMEEKSHGLSVSNINDASTKQISLENIFTLSSYNREDDLASSKLPFVWKLYEMLEEVANKEKEDIVSWVDNGKAFKVHKLKSFVDDIIPQYFRQSKYKSFQRQLYFYEFTRIQSGPHAGAYRHPKFIKGVKTLCLSMTPKKTRRNNKKGSQEKEQAKEHSALQGNNSNQNINNNSSSADPSEWMTQMENLITYGADPVQAAQRQAAQRRSSASRYESIDPTSLERAGPSDGDVIFVFGGKPFHFVETQFSDLPC